MKCDSKLTWSTGRWIIVLMFVVFVGILMGGCAALGLDPASAQATLAKQILAQKLQTELFEKGVVIKVEDIVDYYDALTASAEVQAVAASAITNEGARAFLDEQGRKYLPELMDEIE